MQECSGCWLNDNKRIIGFLWALPRFNTVAIVIFSKVIDVDDFQIQYGDSFFHVPILVYHWIFGWKLIYIVIPDISYNIIYMVEITNVCT